MHSQLLQIVDKNRPALNDYIRSYEIWKEISTDDRNEFYKLRLQHALKFGGTFFDDGVTLSTSGTSIGLSKKYRWGPNFLEAHKFHEHLCFGDLDYDISLALFFDFNKPQYNIAMSKRRSSVPEYVCHLSPTAINAQHVMSFCKERTKRRQTLIRILPSQAEILFRKELEFFNSFPSNYVFHVTGEICDNYVKDQFRKLGLELRDTMKVWNGGASFYTCKYGFIHWNDFTSMLDCTEDDLISTDLFNLAQIFYKVPTNDYVKITNYHQCKCGATIQTNNWKQKPCVVTLNGKLYDWYGLRRDFINSYSTITKIDNINKAWESILGLSIGIAQSAIKISYETRSRIDNDIIASICADLSTKWGKQTTMQHGLKHNHFKTRRVFLIT